jgi:hypothetical protein
LGQNVCKSVLLEKLDIVDEVHRVAHHDRREVQAAGLNDVSCGIDEAGGCVSHGGLLAIPRRFEERDRTSKIPGLPRKQKLIPISLMVRLRASSTLSDVGSSEALRLWFLPTGRSRPEGLQHFHAPFVRRQSAEFADRKEGFVFLLAMHMQL